MEAFLNPMMNEDRELIVQGAREFAINEVIPGIDAMENQSKWPIELFRRAGELGYLAMTWPEEYGGLGLDWVTQMLVYEELSKGNSTFGVAMGAHSVLAGGAILYGGTEEQKKKYLPGAASGETVLALAHTEPVGFSNYSEYGSAVLDGDEWVINAGKIFCTNLEVANVFIVDVVTSEVDMNTLTGISCFIVEANTPGVEIGKIEHKLGWRGSSTGSVNFRNVRVPKENLLGLQDMGLFLVSSALTDEFMSCGALALGQAEGAYEKTFEYTRNRIQCGVSMYDKYQVIRHRLVTMAVEIQTLRGLVYQTAELKDQDQINYIQGRMCKVKGAEVSQYVAEQAIQLHGGNGVVVETGIERYWRDAKVLHIGGGSLECLMDEIVNLLGM